MSDGIEHPALANWLRNEIPTSAGRPLGTGYQASVHLYQSPIGPVVVKRAHNVPVLSYFTARSLRREYAIYERLHGIVGVPRCYGLIDGRCLALEYVEGQSLRHHDLEHEQRDEFFDRLLETLQAMHRAGIAHGDLKRKDNILVGPGERPYVIDFGIAYSRDRRGPFWNRLLFELLRQMDYNAWIKLKYRGRIEDLSREDAELYRPLWIERIARWIRIPWQKITLRRLRNRRRNGRPQ